MSTMQHWLPETARRKLRNHQNLPEQRSFAVYWMQRSQRILHNPAWELAIEAANRLQLPLVVLFALDPSYPGGQERHFHFMMQGLDALAQELQGMQVPLIQLHGDPGTVVPQWAAAWEPTFVIGDENPLRHAEQWRQQVAGISCPFITVDADVIVPTQLLPKEEYAARTIRPKIHRVWDEYLTPWEAAEPRFQETLPGRLLSQHTAKPSEQLAGASLAQRARAVAAWSGGTVAAQHRLQRFLQQALPTYHKRRNEPAVHGTSALSPYLHFGHIGPHTVAWAVQATTAPTAAKEAFLEEMIVRRELAVNFVGHNPQYDRLESSHAWAQKTLQEHWHDRREYVYSLEQLEAAQTHDPLWNASQTQLLQEGWMHGYLRMYWAKKILHWTTDPAEAWQYALDLNDKYQLDGRDPNGYTGVAWAIGGKHDRAWGPEREIFGKIRYMSYESTRRKFDSQAYIKRYGGDTAT